MRDWVAELNALKADTEAQDMDDDEIVGIPEWLLSQDPPVEVLSFDTYEVQE